RRPPLLLRLGEFFPTADGAAGVRTSVRGRGESEGACGAAMRALALLPPAMNRSKCSLAPLLLILSACSPACSSAPEAGTPENKGGPVAAVSTADSPPG